VEETKHH